MEKYNSPVQELKDISQNDIIEAIKVCLQTISPDNENAQIKPTTTLKNMVYYILKSFFLDGKKYVVAECPTGSGKTIIGFMTHFCIEYLIRKKHKDFVQTARPKNSVLCTSYFLTSNKVLQEQIENDIKRFEFQNYLKMLKGVANYECIPANDRYKNDYNYRATIDKNNPNQGYASYEQRFCRNYSGEKLKEKFSECFDKCPYKTARSEAAEKSCSILNYAYFLNVMRSIDDGLPSHLFSRRPLTICDEAHLIPDIICNMFNYEFTSALTTRIFRLIDGIRGSYGNKDILDKLYLHTQKMRQFFNNPINRLSEFIDYVKLYPELKELIGNVMSDYQYVTGFIATWSEDINKIKEQIESIIVAQERIEKLINERPEDCFFESEKVLTNDTTGYKINVYKHILKDLKEAELVKDNLLSKIHFGLFMSATLGDCDEYAKLMGMEEGEYLALNLPSTFDFSKSPIYMCESGYLNYSSFDRNIDKILLDTIKICNQHPNEKGLIHTGTFKITNLLKDKIYKLGNTIDVNRFLFYQTTHEKEQLIETLRNSTIPYILCGPSLYEGIDLPDDKCRFQILIKVPYSKLNPYIKKKMERYPFWYKRNCIEKIIQAIGRSNRHKNDYSTIYLMDSLFEKIIYDTNDTIVNRLEYKKIY